MSPYLLTKGVFLNCLSNRKWIYFPNKAWPNEYDIALDNIRILDTEPNAPRTQSPHSTPKIQLGRHFELIKGLGAWDPIILPGGGGDLPYKSDGGDRRTF